MFQALELRSVMDHCNQHHNKQTYRGNDGNLKVCLLVEFLCHIIFFTERPRITCTQSYEELVKGTFLGFTNKN
jgi:hypothetical protein